MDQGTVMMVNGNIVRRPLALTDAGVSSTQLTAPLPAPGSSLAMVPSNSALSNVPSPGMFMDPGARRVYINITMHHTEPKEKLTAP